jgi:uncharacterized repeat protein (TIGR01451 family)
VQKDVDLTTINAPETLKYTITVKNTGNVDITNVVLSDDLAGAATLDSGDAVDAGVLNVGETWTRDTGRHQCRHRPGEHCQCGEYRGAGTDQGLCDHDHHAEPGTDAGEDGYADDL